MKNRELSSGDDELPVVASTACLSRMMREVEYIEASPGTWRVVVSRCDTRQGNTKTDDREQ